MPSITLYLLNHPHNLKKSLFDSPILQKIAMIITKDKAITLSLTHLVVFTKNVIVIILQEKLRNADEILSQIQLVELSDTQ